MIRFRKIKINEHLFDYSKFPIIQLIDVHDIKIRMKERDKKTNYGTFRIEKSDIRIIYFHF